MTRLRARLASACLTMILSLVLGVAGFEIVSRRVGLNLPTLEDPSERERLFAYDATKGWFHTPGARAQRYINGPDAGRIKINSLGLRGPEIDIRPKRGIRRILLLGDSFAFGAGVDNKHTFSAHLGRRLGPAFEVVNMGVTGYSTDQELILFEELGAKLHPKLVLLLMCDNDFEANTLDFVNKMNYKPYFELGRGGVLLRRNNPVPRLSTAENMRLWLGRHSNTFKLLKAIGLGRKSRRTPIERPWLYNRLVVAVSRPGTPDVRLAGRLVEEIRKRVEVAGASLIVLNTGHRNEKTGLFRQLRKRLRGKGIEYFPLEDTLNAARERKPDGLWDFPLDTHWNVDATVLAAETVAGFLKRRSFGPPRPARQLRPSPRGSKR
jgi:hypothetical protein